MAGYILLFVFLIFTDCMMPTTEEKMLGIHDLVAHNNYNKNLRPNYGGKPVEVKLRTVLTTLGPVSEYDMTFQLSFNLQQWWYDPRLKNNGSYKEITSTAHPGQSIWVPDICIVNALQVRHDQFTRTVISRNGTVYFSQKVSARCTCYMDLTNYPMDSQQCGVQLESYAYSKQDLSLQWKSTVKYKVPEKQKISLTGYDVMHITKTSQDNVYEGEEETNVFENLYLHIHVKRTSVYYVYKGFLPTIFLMLFNIGSYWVPDTAMPARVTLIITTFLANMFILQSISEQTVKVSYTTAMQLFLLVNLMFLMASIMQYLLILNLKKQSKQRKRKNGKDDDSQSIPLQRKDSSQNQNGSINKHLEVMEKAILLSNAKNDNVHILDRIFRLLMPFLYLLFCTVYFSHFLT